jgi:hypothetical protein
LQSNLTHLLRSQYVPGIGLGVAKCPFDPNDNSTAVWVEEGNPGNLPALYSGTNAEFTKADTVIFRTDLYNLTTGRRLYTFKRTLKYDSKWLDSQYTTIHWATPLFSFINSPNTPTFIISSYTGLLKSATPLIFKRPVQGHSRRGFTTTFINETPVFLVPDHAHYL